MMPQRQRAAAADMRQRADIGALEAQRAELKSQMQSLTERRMLLSMQEGQASGAALKQLQDRIKSLDDRIASTDDQLNAIDDKVNAAYEQGIQGPQAPPTPGQIIVRPPFGPDVRVFGGGRSGPDTADVIAVVAIEQAVFLVLVGLIAWRWARRRVTAAVSRLAPEDTHRFEQLQNSVDVMAVEVERIAEGQRYVAKILSEKAIEAPR